MELADAVVITKADKGNEKTAKHAQINYKNALHLFPKNKNNWIPKVLTCSSIENKGIDKTWDTIESFRQHNIENGWLKENRNNQNLFWFYEKLNNLIESNFYGKKGIKNEIEKIIIDIEKEKLDPFNAASKLFNQNES